MFSSFLVINVCNQGKTLCSPCRLEQVPHGRAVPHTERICKRTVVSRVFPKKTAREILWPDLAHQIHVFSRIQQFSVNPVRIPSSPYPGKLWINAVRRVEPGFIRWTTTCQVFPSYREGSPEDNGSRENSFLLIWFQQVLERRHTGWQQLRFLGSFLTRGKRVGRIMGQSSQRFSGRFLCRGRHAYWAINFKRLIKHFSYV